ncbi:MAG TPA: RNA polymerase sigma factor [Terriglobia bacterium]|nr:RNA polymerase sigma factor [Terriglobia bacterium]
MAEIIVAELESSKVGAEAAEQAFHMDEQTFRLFYEKTARSLGSYLARLCNDVTLAEDLVQESYYRFLRADLKSSDEAYQKNYLYRIGTNLARDHWRRWPQREKVELEATEELRSDDRTAEQVQQRADLGKALQKLKPREREILWLAYVEGSSHKEIAEVVGLRAGSIRLLLFRARRKMAELIRKGGNGEAL